MDTNGNPKLGKPAQPMINILPGTGILIALCLATHIFRVIFGDFFEEQFLFAAFSAEVLHAGLRGVSLPYPVISWASPLSYGFLHGGWAHLGMNMAFLLAFGTGIERAMGTRRLLLFFVILTLLSTLGSIANYLITSQGHFMIGASGAISGLLGAFFRMRQKGGASGLLIYVIINLVIATIGGGIGGDMAIIAWEAHVAGAIAGYLFVPLMFGRNIFARH